MSASTNSFLKSITSPVISLFILIIGNGFLMTLVQIRARLEGFSSETTGYLASAYFAGILIGAMKINKIVEGIGHIRAFAFFASIVSITTLLQGMFVFPAVWIALRFLFGLSMAGIFITIESWLLVKSSLQMRGLALSIYMTVFYAAQSVGQLFLGFFAPDSIDPFCFVVLLACLSVLPLTIIKTQAPIIEEQSVLSPLKLFKISPFALFAGVFSGLILGPIYGQLPIYAQELNFSVKEISWVMGAVIFGGLVFQWPIGAISDRIDRRKVLLVSSILVGILAALIVSLPHLSYTNFLIVITFFGGVCFVIYPLSVSHACDLVEAKDIVATTGAVLLSYGIGSIIGPILAAYTMTLFGVIALFYFLGVVAAMLSAITLVRVLTRPPLPKDEKLNYSNMPRTTPLAAELDPRSKQDESAE